MIDLCDIAKSVYIYYISELAERVARFAAGRGSYIAWNDGLNLTLSLTPRDSDLKHQVSRVSALTQLVVSCIYQYVDFPNSTVILCFCRVIKTFC